VDELSKTNTYRILAAIRRVPLAVLAALWAWCAGFAQTPGNPSPIHSSPINSLEAVASLSNAQASNRPAADFVATVTYFRGYEKTLFVQDGNAAIYVSATTNLQLEPGDRVRVRGSLRQSFRPYVESKDITLVGHGAMPQPAKATFEEMIRMDIEYSKTVSPFLDAKIVFMTVPAILTQLSETQTFPTKRTVVAMRAEPRLTKILTGKP